MMRKQPEELADTPSLDGEEMMAPEMVEDESEENPQVTVQRQRIASRRR